MLKNSVSISDKSKLAVLLFLGVAIVSVVILIYSRFEHSKSQNILFSDQAGRRYLEGVIKLSDVDNGDQDTRYVVTGRVSQNPRLENDNWIFVLQSGQKKYHVDLGKPDYLIGTNQAYAGVMSSQYKAIKVGELIKSLKKDTPVMVQVITGFQGKPAESSKCQQQCQEQVALVNSQGLVVQDVLESGDQLESREIQLAPVAQVTFDSK